MQQSKPNAEMRRAPPKKEAPQSDKKKVKRDPLIGKVVGGCEIISLLGSGSMGAVYKARQLSLDRVVAIKTIREGLLKEEQLFHRFRQEARTVSQFSTPHVVQVHEVGLDQGIHFLVMEYVSGGNLLTLARKQPENRLGARDALRYMTHAAVGLLEAEKLRVIHRDIKPENLLLDSGGRVKIADFGIAKLARPNHSATADTAILGTPLYMSPEQAQAKSVSHKSDMYSLGATFFRLLTGRPPVSGKSTYDILFQRIHTKYLSPARVVPDGSIHPGLSELIERMTARDSRDRPASFNEVLDHLNGLHDRRARSTRWRPVTKRGRTSAGRRAAVVLGSLVATLVAAVAVALALTQPHGFRFEQPDGPPVVDAQTPDGGDGSVVTDPQLVDPPIVTDTPPDPVPDPVPVPPIVEDDPTITDDLRPRVEALRRRIASGPDAATAAEVRTLIETTTTSGAGSDGIALELEALLADCEAGLEVARRLGELPSPAELDLEPPFDALPEHRRRLEAAFAAADEHPTGPEIRGWLDSRRQELASQLVGSMRESLRSLLVDARNTMRRFQRREATVEEAHAMVESLRRTQRNVLETFPRLLEGRDNGRPGLPEAISTFERAIERRRELDHRIARIEEEARTLHAMMMGVASSAEWSADLERRVLDEARNLEDRIRRLGRADRSVPTDSVEKTLSEVIDRVHAWRRHVKLIGETAALLADQRLEAAAVRIIELGRLGLTDPTRDRLAEGHGKLVEAFAAIDDLKLETARDHFREAAKALAVFDGAARYARSCADRVEELIERTAEMAPVPPGKVQIPGSQEPISVAGFFIDRHETSVGQFLEFVEEQKAVSSFDEVRHLWPDEAAFRAGREPPHYIDEGRYINRAWPIEEVNYHQALAYLRSRGRDLPTLEEWWLAAKGPLVRGKHRYRHPVYPEDIRRGDVKPAPVDRGGQSRALAGARTVHHIVGNVAEWLKASSNDGVRAQVVGGRYLDSREEYFTGELRDTMEQHDTRRGYGFRGIVRPAQVLAELMPVRE